MHQDTVIAVICLWIISFLSLGYAGTRDLIDTDFLIGSSSGTSQLSSINSAIRLGNEMSIKRSRVQCNHHLPIDDLFWPMGYRRPMFGALVNLCAWHGNPRHNLHLRCSSSYSNPKVEVTPSDPTFALFINDAILLAYCLANCKCERQAAPVLDANPWTKILDGWAVNFEDNGLVLGHGQSGQVSFTTLIPPTAAGGAQASEATAIPESELAAEHAEEAEDVLETLSDISNPNILHGDIQYSDDFVGPGPLGETGGPSAPGEPSELDPEPGTLEDSSELGRPSWLDSEAGGREDSRPWWELTDDELLALFPEGSVIHDPIVAARVTQLRQAAVLTAEEDPGESSGGNYQSAIGNLEEEVEEEEVDSGEIQPDYSDWPQGPFDPSQLNYVPAGHGVGWIFFRGYIVGIFRTLSRGKMQIVWLTPQQAATIDFPTEDLFPSPSAASSSSSSSTTTSIQTSASPPPPSPPYRLVRDPGQSGNRGALLGPGFIYGTWHQNANGQIVKRIFKNPVPRDRSGRSSDQQSCHSTGTCALDGEAGDIDNAPPFPSPGSGIRPAPFSLPTDLSSSFSSALLGGSRIPKQHHRPRPAPALDALLCGSSSCSGFDSVGCGNTCKCVAKPQIKSQGDILWLGACMAWNVAAQALSGVGVASGGSGGGGRRKKKPKSRRRKRRRGLSMGSDGVGEDREDGSVEEVGEMDEMGEADQLEQMEVACPCNVSYVSSSCCGAAKGLVWEGPEMKLGVLTLEREGGEEGEKEEEEELR